MSQWQKGKVQWFDKSSGEGVVVGEDGVSYYVHYSTIVPNKSKTKTTEADAHRRNLDAGDSVKFQLYKNIYSARIDKIQPV